MNALSRRHGAAEACACRAPKILRASEKDGSIIQRTGQDWVVTVYQNGVAIDGARGGSIVEIEAWLRSRYPDLPVETRTEKSEWAKKNLREPRVLLAREEVSERMKPARPPRGVEPVTLVGGPGSKCRPFLKIEKDADKFAACNALADEIGPLDTPKKMFRIIDDAIGGEVNEVFGVLMVDLHLRFKGLAETGRGEPSSVMAPLQPTLQVALMAGAHAIVILHCHPSGVEAEPSDADKETTDAFADACEVVGLPLIDHIIVSGTSRKRSFFSFLEAGLL